LKKSEKEDAFKRENIDELRSVCVLTFQIYLLVLR
jgi:hypothetical protein